MAIFTTKCSSTLQVGQPRPVGFLSVVSKMCQGKKYEVNSLIFCAVVILLLSIPFLLVYLNTKVG